MTELTGTIFDIKRFAIHDGPGIRTTVFFKGCPLGCWWCHNPESRAPEPQEVSSVKETIGRKVGVTEIIQEVVRDTVFYDQSGGGVTFSGGEPMLQLEFLKALLIACRGIELHTTVDTSGFAPWESFETLNGLVDLYLYDLKLIDESEHRRHTGVSNKSILHNLTRLAEGGAKINVRVPLIPGYTDTEKNLSDILTFIQTLPGLSGVSLLPYNPLGEDKARRFGLADRIAALSMQTKTEMERYADKFKACGYRVQVGG